MVFNIKEIKSIAIANKYSETEFDMRFLDESYNRNKRFIFDNIRCIKIFSMSYSVMQEVSLTSNSRTEQA